MSHSMNRRALLKGLVALPISTTVSSNLRVRPSIQVAPPKQKSVLHLYCHGLHAYVFYKDYLLLLTPLVMSHRYLAGTWQREVPMRKGETYSLLGVNGELSVPAINRNLYLSNIKDIRADLSFCQVRLPFPKQFVSLRYVKANFEDESAISNASQISEVPLLQMLEYDVTDLAGLRLENLTGWEPLRENLSIQQLHFFAEPDVIVPEDHALNAFRDLIAMFPGVRLRLTSIPPPAQCPPTPDPNDVLGILLEQEESLVERIRGCAGELNARIQSHARGKPKGAQPANCFSVIANAQ